MSLSTILFLILRPLHVLLAAIWIGATVFTSYLLMPAVNEAGEAGGQVMIRMNRRIVPFFAALGGSTVVTGIYLYWRFTGGFDPGVSRSHAGMAFGIGGVCGLLAAIIGGSIVGRSSKKLVEILGQASRLPDGQEKGALLRTADGLRSRMSSFGHVVVALQVIALVLMALGHYI